MSDNHITISEYEEEISSLVDDAIDESDSQEDFDQYLWESVDGHQWVIYTDYNYQVLRNSPNDGHAIKEWGSGATEDGQLDTAVLAFSAMYADCMEEFWSREYCWDEEDEDEVYGEPRLRPVYDKLDELSKALDDEGALGPNDVQVVPIPSTEEQQ